MQVFCVNLVIEGEWMYNTVSPKYPPPLGWVLTPDGVKCVKIKVLFTNYSWLKCPELTEACKNGLGSSGGKWWTVNTTGHFKWDKDSKVKKQKQNKQTTKPETISFWLLKKQRYVFIWKAFQNDEIQVPLSE